MSDSHAISVRSAPPDLTGLAALAAALQETAQALLALSPAGAANEPAHAASDPVTALAAAPSAAPPVPHLADQTARQNARQNEGETRSFYFPAATIHQERELLRKYRVEDFQGLLEEAHTLLAGLVKVMRSVHKDVRVKGHVIVGLGAQIDHASALVLRMRNVYGNVIPVRR